MFLNNYKEIYVNTMIYAGIGSRETPSNILIVMRKMALLMALDGLTLSTGAAQGADQAFAEGAAMVHGQINLHLPWGSYELDWLRTINAKRFVLRDDDLDAYRTVDHFHPAPHKLTRGARALHARNYNIIKDASFVMCWTPDGRPVGGTAQAIRIALHAHKQIINLGRAEDLEKITDRITKRHDEWRPHFGE